MAKTVLQGLLDSASNLLGREELALRLKVHSSLLEAWMSGHATMPTDKLVLLTEALGEIAQRE
jgi:hypothetical protein